MALGTPASLDCNHEWGIANGSDGLGPRPPLGRSLRHATLGTAGLLRAINIGGNPLQNARERLIGSSQEVLRSLDQLAKNARQK